MGSWGTGLYQDDVTCDLKSEYLNRLRVGYSNEEATIELIDYYTEEIEDEEEGPLFWFALADTQWRYGRLLPTVKEKALKHIDSGTDLERWKENKQDYQKRKLVLEELKSKLNAPLPPERSLKKLTIQKATWEVGDVLLYQIHNGELQRNEKVRTSKWYNKYILLRVVGITKTNIGSLPRDPYSHEQNVVKIYNWVGDSEPNLDILNTLKFIVVEDSLYKRRAEEKFILSFDKKELQQLDFKVIKKDNSYEKEYGNLDDGVGITWPNITTIDSNFIRVLNVAEQNGALIDETKR